jgi:hypothetical protein
MSHRQSQVMPVRRQPMSKKHADFLVHSRLTAGVVFHSSFQAVDGDWTLPQVVPLVTVTNLDDIWWRC